MSDLFSHRRQQILSRIAPLADRLRPRCLDDFVGQEAILGHGRLLRRAIAADRVGNLILHGPPGTGKTTLARIIAGSTRAHFSSLNAVLAGVKDLRAEVDGARQRLEQHGLRTILFIDEVHRFNSAQQDALLPWVENGTLTLIGATTENPYFEVNKALVSRSRLFRLQALEAADLRLLLERALRDEEHGYGGRQIRLTDEASAHLIDVAGGDARSLLNALELAVETTPAAEDDSLTIDLTIAEESIQQRAVLYDKQGDAHFDTISAFIKSIRGSDPDAALFWLARMVEAGENPRFILRRLLISAGEDIGLADPQAIGIVEACAAAFDRVGLPEGLYPLAHATLYLAVTEKSNSSLGFFDAIRTVREANRQQVPPHLRDAHRDGKAFGDGVGYRYPHAYAEHWVAQQYLPSALQGEVFWQPGALGWEGERRQRLQQRRAAQLAAAAETAAEHPELLSSSPEDPLLTRWLHRQAAAAGERLDLLRQRLWQEAQIRRLDRVLVLEARSLLWALDPLQKATEGEVAICLPTADDQARLEAQLQLLDQLQRPSLLLVPPDQPGRLEQQLLSGKPRERRFEWIVGRQPFQEAGGSLDDWLELIDALTAAGSQCRFLFSRPLVGPAAGLRQVLSRRPSSRLANGVQEGVLKLLDSILPLEAAWLSPSAAGSPPAMAGQEMAPLVMAGLEQRGWRVQREVWQETLELTMNEALLQRWFGDQGSYRQRVERELGSEQLGQLISLFRHHLGTALPQTLEHSLVMASRA